MALTVTQKPLAEVSAGLSRKTPIGAALDTAQWQTEVPAVLRDEAFFSATVESVRALTEAQDGLQQVLDLVRGSKGEIAMDRGRWIETMQQTADRLGLRNADPDKRGGLQDFGSERRLALIYNQQISSAQNRAYYLSGQDPDILAAWPAQELVRIRASTVPRKWAERWTAAGGKLYSGRMIALKTDPIWREISRFRKPYPPFDFNSGMGLDEIDREEAEALGLIAPGEEIKPSVERDQAKLEASAKGMKPDALKALKQNFGNQIRITADGMAVWRGSEIIDLAQKAIQDLQFKGRVYLGNASEKLVAAAELAGENLQGYEFDLSADDIRHVLKGHGSNAETNRGQVPVRALDFAVLPYILQNPDVVGLGTEPDTIGITKEMEGQSVTIWWLRGRKGKKAGLRTLWIKPL